jgi:small subunit ribosomal protein S17
MAKTIVVKVRRRFKHPRFHKTVTSFKKYYAHDEDSDANIGDTVRIAESRPLSRLKRWALVKVEARNPDADLIEA